MPLMRPVKEVTHINTFSSMNSGFNTDSLEKPIDYRSNPPQPKNTLQSLSKMRKESEEKMTQKLSNMSREFKKIKDEAN